MHYHVEEEEESLRLLRSLSEKGRLLFHTSEAEEKSNQLTCQFARVQAKEVCKGNLSSQSSLEICSGMAISWANKII